MSEDSKSKITFPVGYHGFHKKQLYNFQLNRWYALGYLSFEEVEAAGKKIKTFEDWKRVMLEMADRAIAEGRYIAAAFLYRAAEFYTLAGDRDKEMLYDKFIEYFYMAFDKDDIERFIAPYQDTFLRGMKIPPVYGEKKGTIVMHGGFDSFIEEFYSMMRYFSEKGYEVIAFEGPGQGGTLKKFGIPLDIEWEKPTKAILDYFDLDDVTLLGISMGGYFCLRAAAFEPRIKRVIASGHAYDYSKTGSAFSVWIMNFFADHLRDFTNKASYKKIDQGGMEAWYISNLMYITQLEAPMDAFDYAMKMNEENLHSELVTQDVLILTGREDHFVPFKLHDGQIKALTQARSVTDRIFTEEEQAQNHCQIGNVGLALEVMVDWIEGRKI